MHSKKKFSIRSLENLAFLIGVELDNEDYLLFFSLLVFFAIGCLGIMLQDLWNWLG
jgi:hypothetical protein